MKNSRSLLSLITEGDFLKYAIIFSLCIHLMIFFQLSFHYKNKTRKSVKNLEVTYYNLKLQAKNVDTPLPKKQEKKESDKKTEVLIDKPSVTATPIKDISKLDNTIVLDNKKLPATVTEIQIKRKISVPPLKSEKISNPLYQSYYQTIRTMIKNRAYANYSKMDTGEVYVTFVLLSNGTLKQLQLIEERTSANQFLKDVSFKSIKESTPFPPFPRDLNYPELSFNVIISFEVEP